MSENTYINIITFDNEKFNVGYIPNDFAGLTDMSDIVYAMSVAMEKAAQKAYNQGRSDYEAELGNFLNRHKRQLF